MIALGHANEFRALKGLFTVLNSYGKMFDAKLWELIFRGVLLPIFDNVRYASRADLLQEVRVTTEVLHLTLFRTMNG